jgi:hypothetical protein
MDATGPNADLLFPSDAHSLSLAREIYGNLASLPILSAHTHVEAPSSSETSRSRVPPTFSSLLIHEYHPAAA